jgi:hypothetical protein
VLCVSVVICHRPGQLLVYGQMYMGCISEVMESHMPRAVAAYKSTKVGQRFRNMRVPYQHATSCFRAPIDTLGMGSRKITRIGKRNCF